MLNPKTQERELCYVVEINDIQPIPNYDRVELATVNGWHIIVQKNQFKVGDKAIYFEVDSRVPESAEFDFLAKRKYKIKTLKMCGCISQGLLMSFADFGFAEDEYNVGDFLTKKLNITYADDEDNARKAPSVDKYKKMEMRHRKLFKNSFVKKVMRYEVGRKIMFAFFGKKKDKKSSFPSWVVKTDEERAENLPYLFNSENRESTHWMVTEKIDGTSATFTLKKIGKHKYDYRVCSRNVCFDKPDKKCFYETNVYTQIAEKYDMEKKLKDLFDDNDDIVFVTIQGEIYGSKIQKRDYNMTGIDLAIFNVIFGYKDGSTERLNPREMENLMEVNNLPTVPVLDYDFILPSTCDEMLEYAASENSKIDGGMREGVVLRSFDGKQSFKAVSRDFLLKYHG